jgi:hypothetical protein
MKAKNKEINVTHDTDVKSSIPNVELQNNQLTSTNDTPTKSARISAHSMKWAWTFKGNTMRKPDKAFKMRGWGGGVYYWKGGTIVLKLRTMELTMRSRPYKTTEKMISATWSKADLIAREFSKFAQIAITPIYTEHPMGIANAHLVDNQ